MTRFEDIILSPYGKIEGISVKRGMPRMRGRYTLYFSQIYSFKIPFYTFHLRGIMAITLGQLLAIDTQAVSIANELCQFT